MRAYSTDPAWAEFQPKTPHDLQHEQVRYKGSPNPKLHVLENGHLSINFPRQTHKEQLAAMRRRHKKRARRSGQEFINQELENQ